MKVSVTCVDDLKLMLFEHSVLPRDPARVKDRPEKMPYAVVVFDSVGLLSIGGLGLEQGTPMETNRLRSQYSTLVSDNIRLVSDLASTETFSDEEVSDYHEDESSEIFSRYSDLDSSDYTPSLSFDSGSEFSEKSSSDSPVLHTQSLYLVFKEQFCRSTIPNDFESSRHEQSRESQSELLRFEDEEVEESNQRLRERERSHAYLRDCAKAYCSRMDHTDFIPRLRFFIVQWIVERAYGILLFADCKQECFAMELQPETLFLGVSLLDRFLREGSFKSERTLVLVGIASLTLATRIEENQPYNR
ncbi:hypothetical protein Bca4012_037934 [Brassica carinata]